MIAYDASLPSVMTADDAEASVGRRAAITLTGKIIGWGESTSGPYVRFQVDERFGFRNNFTLVMDLDPFVVIDPQEVTS